MKLAATALVVLVVVWLALVVLAAVFQRSLIYFPFAHVPAPEAMGLEGVEQVEFATQDGLRLRGWFVPGRAPARFTLLVFNGNAGNRAYRAPLAQAFQDHGVSVLLLDYRGFGGNEGQPSEEGLALDARAARAYVDTRPGVDPSRIAYFGESLGAAVALRLAVEHPPAVLVLRSPFTSMAAVGRAHYPFLPVEWLLRDRYASLDRLAGLRCPLLVIAGDGDSIVPAAQSRALYETAPGPKRLVIVGGADHNDLALVAGPQVIEATLKALEDWGTPRREPARAGQPAPR